MMQPLKLLNNVQKARLLHGLFLSEIPDFISYLYEYAESVLESKEELRTSWQGGMFSVDFWFELAEDVKKKTLKYGKDLRKSSPLFADQLFDGYSAMFTIHVLNQYGVKAETDLKFKQAIDLLFT